VREKQKTGMNKRKKKAEAKKKHSRNDCCFV